MNQLKTLYHNHRATGGFSLETEPFRKINNPGMRIYNLYNIKDTDQFNPLDFPKLEEEIVTIRQMTATAHKDVTTPIIIDYLKNQSLNEEWRAANPRLIEMIADKHSVVHHLQSLFESCRHNVNFTRDYEEFIRENLMPGVIDPKK